MRAALVLLAVAATAQTPAARFPITGMVVNSEGGGPVKRALVTATCFPNRQGEATQPVRPSAVTDDSGVFRFDGIPAGHCSVTAQRPGFSQSAGDRGIAVSGPVTDARVSLEPLGAITGKVIDRDGVPVYGATILVITSAVDDGLRTSHLSRTVRTDDRGVYRVWDLTPGKYYVKAAGKRAVTNIYAADNGPIGVFPDSFPPTYFGGATKLTSATPVVVGKGTQAEADIRVTWQPAFPVSGTIENFAPRQSVEFELSIDGEEFAPSSINVHGDTGRFEILDVLPGTYLLRAKQKENWAERSITVRGELKGVTVQLAAPVDIPVAQRVSNPDARRAVDLHGRPVQLGNLCWTKLWQIGYPPSDSSVPVQRREMPVAAEDKRALQRVPVGTHRVVFDCGSGYIQSATSGTHDLLADPTLVVRPGAAPAPIEITARSGGGSVDVQLPRGVAERGGQVLLVPQFAPSAGPTLLGDRATLRRRLAGVGGDGGYAADGLAPGPYLAYAFRSDFEVEYRNPEFLKSLRGGTALQITEGDQTKVTVTEVIQ